MLLYNESTTNRTSGVRYTGRVRPRRDGCRPGSTGDVVPSLAVGRRRHSVGAAHVHHAAVAVGDELDRQTTVDALADRSLFLHDDAVAKKTTHRTTHRIK